MQYLLFNKPDLVMSSFTDPQGRQTLKDFIPIKGVYAAGRLDYDSEGLLLLTDDGKLIQRLTDPRFDHPKTYYAQVEGVAVDEMLAPLRLGITLRGEKVKPAHAEIIAEPNLPPRPRPVRNYHPTSWLKIILREGKKHQVRRMTAAIGLPCLRLVRVAIGELKIDGLNTGKWRELTSRERKLLKIED